VVVLVTIPMPTPTERLAATFHEEAGFLASNLGEESTGVEGTVLWIFCGEPARGGSILGPRILVVAGAALKAESLFEAVAVRLSAPLEVSGSLPPRVKLRVLQFLEANRDVLLQYWGGRMGTQNMIDLLVRV
jgi:hypothetical protein